MPYSEAAFFYGDHCQHCAAWEEHKRLTRKRDEAIYHYNRRRGLI